MNIAIDIDGVISITQPTIERYATKYNEEVVKRGLELHPNKAATYEMFDWTPEENADFCEKYLAEIVVQSQVYDGAKETIFKLHEAGHKIFIISARAKPMFKDPYGMTVDWLLDKGIYFDELLVGSIQKAEVCRDNGIDLLIDDEVQYIRGASEYGMEVLAFDHPWNEGVEGEKIHRVHGWDEIWAFFEQR